MRRRIAIALSALIVVALPLILVGNTLWVLTNSWFVEAQYALPGFPDDPQGLPDQERTELAIRGIDSIRPTGEGVSLLRDARLPGGDPAFEQREIDHMEDVRALIAAVLIAWAVALVLAVAAVLGLRRLGDPGSVGRALVLGAVLTVAVMALVGVVMLVNFDAFFDSFHAVFFEGDSWRFDSSFTVRRLYPYFFWGVAGATMAALVALQAGALVIAARRRRDGGMPPRAEAA